MKKIISIFLSITMLIGIITAVDLSAYAESESGQCGANVFFTLDSATGELVINGSGDMYDYQPADGASPFECNFNIRSVVIENGVTSIGSYMFYDCQYIKYITIPSSVERIGEYAFYNCLRLINIEIPNQVTEIKTHTFYDCESLERISIPNRLTKIGSYAFCNCKRLSNIALPNSLTKISIDAFSGCKSLIGVVLPNNISTIYDYLFYGCELVYVYIPKSVTNIYRKAIDEVEHIYYEGNENDWNSIEFEEAKPNNNIHFEVSLDTEYISITDYDDSTCTTTGIYNSICSICDKEFSKSLIKKNHNYDVIDKVDAVNCGQSGYTLYQCINCGNEYKDTDNPFHHQYALYEVVEPTCTLFGYDKIKCTVCGAESYENFKVSIGHSGEIIEACTPSCVNRGYTKRLCTRCNEEYLEDIVDPYGHNIVDGVCVNCGMEESDCIETSHPAQSYTDNTWMIYKQDAKRIAITFSNLSIIGGWDTLYIYDKDDNEVGCYYDDQVLSKRIVVKGDTVKIRLVTQNSWDSYGFSLSNVQAYYDDCLHQADKTVLNKIEPTCAINGYTGDVYCTECGEIVEEGTVIPIDESKHIICCETVAPDCVNEGFTFDFCYECGSILATYDYTQPTGVHEYETKVYPPTCTEKGYTTHTCSNCNYSYKDSFVKELGHDLKMVSDPVNATCFTEGWTAGYKCTRCDYEKRQEPIKKLAHTYKPYTTKATTSADGKIVKKCSICGKVASTTVIPKASSVKLSATSYTYDGNYKKPSVTVKDSKGNKISTANYSVTYSNNKSVDKASVKITFKGNYSGSKTLYFTINPKGTTISSVSGTSRGFKVNWKKQATQTTGYQIQYSTNSKLDNAKLVTISSNSTTSKTISKLTAKKKYYVRVRTYKTVNGTKYYSAWSGYKSVTTKK